MECLDVQTAILYNVECLSIKLELENLSKHEIAFIYCVGNVFFILALHYM